MFLSICLYIVSDDENKDDQSIIQENPFENVVCEMASSCFGLNVLSNPGLWCLSPHTCKRGVIFAIPVHADNLTTVLGHQQKHRLQR